MNDQLFKVCAVVAFAGGVLSFFGVQFLFQYEHTAGILLPGTIGAAALFLILGFAFKGRIP
jgi:hypothetical protein